MPIGSFIQGVFGGMDWREGRDARKEQRARDGQRFNWEFSNQGYREELRSVERMNRPNAEEDRQWQNEQRDWAREDRRRGISMRDSAAARAAAERARVAGNRDALAGDMIQPEAAPAPAPAPTTGLGVLPTRTAPGMSLAPGAPTPRRSVAAEFSDFLRGL